MKNRRLIRDNGLSLVLFGAFLVTLVGQALAGHRVFNDDQHQAGKAAVPLSTYLTSGHFIEALFENWESEFLQMGMYVVLTAILYQRGSAESKDPDAGEEPPAKPNAASPWPVRRGGWVLKVYENSLSLALFALFVIAFAAHAVGGHAEFNRQRALHDEAPQTLVEFMATPEFWFQSMQNWQSEFFSIGTVVLLSIWLRQKGSPESKQVEAPHASTGG